MPQHIILLIMFQKYNRLKQFADRNGKFGDLPTGHLSSGCDTALHPTVGKGLPPCALVSQSEQNLH